MSNIKAKDLLKHAIENKYAVGYFESWNLESTLAVVRAAELARSPVMIGFCGEYLNYSERKYTEDLYLYTNILKEVARNASVPVATLLNESIDINYVYKGIKAGFDMVMFVDEHMPVNELTVIQKKIVEYAHACDIAVEAEIGSLGMANQATGKTQLGCNSDPEEGARFVKDTGVDALAVAIGNVHLLEGKKANLDMGLLEKLHARIDVPLVLHGGTGIDRASFKEAVALGVAKVNVGAGLKRIAIEAEKNYFEKNNVSTMNPNDILGKGGRYDLAMTAHDAIIEEVVDYIRHFRGENKV